MQLVGYGEIQLLLRDQYRDITPAKGMWNKSVEECLRRKAVPKNKWLVVGVLRALSAWIARDAADQRLRISQGAQHNALTAGCFHTGLCLEDVRIFFEGLIEERVESQTARVCNRNRDQK